MPVELISYQPFGDLPGVYSVNTTNRGVVPTLLALDNVDLFENMWSSGKTGE